MPLQLLIYPIVILIANTIGAISGMGGGVIIKPALQIFDLDSVLIINFYSSVAVFTMSITSTLKQLHAEQHINMKYAIWLGIGSVIGGALGDFTFKQIYDALGDDLSVVVQMVLVIISLILSLYGSSGHIQPLYLAGTSVMFMSGLGLGWLATVLGIGGGPINIACFLVLLGLEIRPATIYSIITIFFSQGAKIIQALASKSIMNVDPLMIIVIIITALLGGWLGAIISNRITEKRILMLFNLVVVFVLILDAGNLIGYLV
ncbi:sulfite exporter TauE/SafE family protein [Lacticaseibacillus paracasei]|uniref:sulfite exporter TauE/SafE family protein n=1 Tax=Lacticaseibacillus paracasei TaxID=1597 RepID=UPI0040456271